MENDDIKNSLLMLVAETKSKAQTLFDSIDENLSPFIVALLFKKNGSNDKFEIYVSENDFGITPEIFVDINEFVKNITTKYKRFCDNQYDLDSWNFREEIKEYKEEIIRRLNKFDPHSGYVYFVDYSVDYSVVKDCRLFKILALRKATFESYYRLTKVKDDNWPYHLSFLEAVISSFFSMPKIPTNSTVEVNEVFLRNAGRSLIETVARSSNGVGSLFFYDNCNEIASMKYEGDVAIGGMILCKQNHKNVKMTITLKKPISINDHRKVRKFLEISDNNTMIVTDSEKIYGFGEIKGKYNPMDEDLFTIRFSGYYKWELLHNNETMMIVEFKLPRLPKEKISEKKFRDDIVRIFSDINHNDISKIWDIIIYASEQKHGTMIVISNNAESEAKRLSTQAIEIEPTTFDANLLRGATSIDGAVLFNEKANCYAIGVILDGLATEDGDSSRGARYNSAIKYYESRKDRDKLMMVIVSEDGMINIIPNLMPLIKHSDITDCINKLKNLLDNYDQKEYCTCMQFLYAKAFYLTKEECDSVNKLKDEIGTKALSDCNFKIELGGNFTPNKNMNDSFYITKQKNNHFQ